jgi:feruloyl esterase
MVYKIFRAFGLLPLAALVCLAATQSAPGADLPATMPASELGARCKDLPNQEFGNIVDAATQITAANIVPATASTPAFCLAQGYISPSIGFELHLPLANWNGKFIHQGCGGYCGTLIIGIACDAYVARGYACSVTDMGHRSTMLDGKWAYNNLQAEADFAFRATHVAALSGKALTRAFYSNAPSRSYYLGCSTGGRQGMVEAQRFPFDFDGIVAGAPVMNETGDGLALLWHTLALSGPGTTPAVTTEKLRALHAAVIAACDMNDGIKDGLIGDARDCAFDPATLACTAKQTATCLTTSELAAVRKLYSGPVTSTGKLIYNGGAQKGSELNWINNYYQDDGQPSHYASMMTDMFRYMVFWPDAGPNWKMTDFNWDEDYKRVGLMESLYSGSNPDLTAFKDAGGKLMVYHGWDDQSVLPLPTVDYYEKATRLMGGPAATQDFFRLFMMPGMNHCTGGAGADMVDYLSYLEAWVEKGEAPERLLATHVKADPKVPSYLLRFPLEPARVEFTRPVFPYPLRTRYSGKGDVNDAASYRAAEPRRP